MSNNETLSNADILDFLMEHTGIANHNQLAAYLSDKYGNVTRQQIKQFEGTKSINLTGMLLREAVEAAKGK